MTQDTSGKTSGGRGHVRLTILLLLNNISCFTQPTRVFLKSLFIYLFLQNLFITIIFLFD